MKEYLVKIKCPECNTKQYATIDEEEYDQPFLDLTHICEKCKHLIISNKLPIGTCNRTGGNVYPSVIDGYSAFSPELDEDLYDIEWTIKEPSWRLTIKEK